MPKWHILGRHALNSHQVTLQMIMNGLLLSHRHPVRHWGCKNEGGKHTLPHGARNMEDKTTKLVLIIQWATMRQLKMIYKQRGEANFGK